MSNIMFAFEYVSHNEVVLIFYFPSREASYM